MKVILIGGPDNQRIVEVYRPVEKIINYQDHMRIEYEKTPAIIQGLIAYKFKES